MFNITQNIFEENIKKSRITMNCVGAIKIWKLENFEKKERQILPQLRICQHRKLNLEQKT